MLNFCLNFFLRISSIELCLIKNENVLPLGLQYWFLEIKHLSLAYNMVVWG